jgi:hypothetical protein
VPQFATPGAIGGPFISNNAPVCKTGTAGSTPAPTSKAKHPFSTRALEVVSDPRGPMVLLEARISSADDRFPTRL